jgi:NAD(P)-dependent dehydrogenase (short-subunit alcohol dehydrogenase family)
MPQRESDSSRKCHHYSDTLLVNALIDLTPMGRAGDADEVAKLALFLASDESSFITGSEFVIDGGFVTGAAAKELRRKILSPTTD